jgi:PAS domain-containing protein
MTPARREALRKATRASARKRRERARERRREWHRQHGYWFFHRWGLYAVPFTRTLRRLGESAAGFITLLGLAERWLCPVADNPPPVPGSRQPATVPRPPARIAAKVARALAQVLWLRPRVLRERARDRAIRLEARLRTVAELQGILHGAAGPEEQARRTAEMRQVLSAETLNEYKQMRVLGMDPGELWPRRLAWRIALRLREVFEDGFDRQRDLKAIRRRAAWLLEVYQLAAEIAGSGSEPTNVAKVSGPADPWAVEEARVKQELEAIGQLQARLERVLAGKEFDAALSLEQARALLPTLEERRRQARARRRKLRRLRQVEQSSAESLGNPFVSPGTVRRRLAGEVHRRGGPPRPPGTAAGAVGDTPAGAGAEEPEEAAARWRQELEELRLRDPEALESDRQEAKERGLAVEELRRRRQAVESRPRPVALRRYWDQALGWCAEIRTGVGRYVARLSEMTGGREAWGWPVVRELELRAEVESQRRVGAGPCALPEPEPVGAGPCARPETGPAPASGVGRPPGAAPTPGTENPRAGFTYPELKRLLAEAFGLAPGWPIPWRYTPPNSAAAADWWGIAPPRPPAPRPVIERRLERVARLAWLMLEADRRRADDEVTRLQEILAAARPGEFEPTARALAGLEARDREAEFRAAERLAKLSEALRQLLEAMYDGYREFERLEADPVWFDAERKQTLRQDLGLEPLPEDFEIPEPPEEFVYHRRKFLARLHNLCTERQEAWIEASSWSDDS